MMKMLVEGIMSAELPWGLILTGVFIAIAVEILKVPVMPFAVGMYPVSYTHLSIRSLSLWENAKNFMVSGSLITGKSPFTP